MIQTMSFSLQMQRIVCKGEAEGTPETGLFPAVTYNCHPSIVENNAIISLVGAFA